MDKTPYEKLPETNTKVFTVFQYYDHSIVTVKRKDKYSKPEVSESIIGDALVKYGALVKDYRTVDEQIAAIRAIVTQGTLADVVMVTVFQFFMPLDGFEKLKGMITNMSEEQLILELFKNNLFNGSIIARNTFPVIVNGKIDVNKLNS